MYRRLNCVDVGACGYPDSVKIHLADGLKQIEIDVARKRAVFVRVDCGIVFGLSRESRYAICDLRLIQA